ncbi:hypothetical protein HD806DRAFT_514388 [Xylariaceae sp. AK1471]|nr:hypothetical protein HD806DRAFT_514388 [Xylariaceae sp. AK1471]
MLEILTSHAACCCCCLLTGAHMTAAMQLRYVHSIVTLTCTYKPTRDVYLHFSPVPVPLSRPDCSQIFCRLLGDAGLASCSCPLHCLSPHSDAGHASYYRDRQEQRLDIYCSHPRMSTKARYESDLGIGRTLIGDDSAPPAAPWQIGRGGEPKAE